MIKFGILNVLKKLKKIFKIIYNKLIFKVNKIYLVIVLLI